MKVVIPVCPSCGSRQVVQIVYGFPGEDLLSEAAAGRVVLGGCIVREEAPTRSCKACGHEWGRFREPRRWA